MLKSWEIDMVRFTECMQNALGDLFIALFIFSGLAAVLIVILIAILFKVLNKDKKSEAVNNGRTS